MSEMQSYNAYQDRSCIWMVWVSVYVPGDDDDDDGDVVVVVVDGGRGEIV